MAMTKKEREAVEALEVELALRWPSYEAPKNVAAPSWGELKGDSLFVAWTFNAYSKRVTQGCSSGTYHSPDRTDKTTAQRACPNEGWFSTELEATKAMRVRMSEKFAAELAEVDRRIAALSAEAHD